MRTRSELRPRRGLSERRDRSQRRVPAALRDSVRMAISAPAGLTSSRRRRSGNAGLCRQYFTGRNGKGPSNTCIPIPTGHTCERSWETTEQHGRRRVGMQTGRGEDPPVQNPLDTNSCIATIPIAMRHRKYRGGSKMAVGRTQMELKSRFAPASGYMIRGVDAMEIVRSMPAGGTPRLLSTAGSRPTPMAATAKAIARHSTQQEGELPPRPVPDDHAPLEATGEGRRSA